MNFANFLLRGVENPYLLITFASMLPFTEIKGGILLGLASGLHPLYVYLICFISSSIPVPIILLLLKPVLNLLKRSRMGKLGNWFEKRILAKCRRLGEEKHIFWKLLSFVSIPAPLTGAYSGSYIASLLDLPLSKGMLAVILGNAIAGAIVLGVGMLFPNCQDEILFGFILLIPIFSVLSLVKNKLKNRKNKIKIQKQEQ